jgi:REP element-mobilizing transposase RayT
MEKFKNKYRIPSARLINWDYGSAGIYFITICTKNREHFFGEIRNGEMQLSEIGKNVQQEWLKTPKIRPDMNLHLGEFVVMPNHFHAILIIGQNVYNSNYNGGNKFKYQSKNLPSIMRGFKSSVTMQARLLKNKDFNWQNGYHDHIVRNKESFDRIHIYIKNNPLKWNEDRFFD